MNDINLDEIVSTDKKVLRHNKKIISDTSDLRDDDITNDIFLSVKMPVYNNDNQIAGLFGPPIQLIINSLH